MVEQYRPTKEWFEPSQPTPANHTLSIRMRAMVQRTYCTRNSFIPYISIEPLHSTILLRVALDYTAMIMSGVNTPKRYRQLYEGRTCPRSVYVAAMGFEPATFRTQGT